MDKILGGALIVWLGLYDGVGIILLLWGCTLLARLVIYFCTPGEPDVKVSKPMPQPVRAIQEDTD